MSWHFGVATGCSIHAPIGSILDVFAAAGVTTVEVGTPPKHFDVWDPRNTQAVACQLRRLHQQAVSIHAPFGGQTDLSDPRSERRHAAIGGVLVAASALARLGGAHVIVHTTDVPRDGHDVGERLRCCADSLRVIGQVCGQLGVRLVVETPLPHLIGGHPDEFQWILAQLDERAGVCIDTGHVTLGSGWAPFAQIAGRRLVHVHANDNHGRFDDHFVPGEGVVRWPEIRESLHVAGFTGWIVLELAYGDIPAISDISGALECARNLLV